jgi:hypothetical protein
MQDNRFSESRLFREAESAPVYPHRRFMPPVKKMYPVGSINRRTRAVFGVWAPYRLSPVPPEKPPQLCRYARPPSRGEARIHNRSDVPDLTQEIFLRMLRILDRDAIRSVEAHLFTVALHVASSMPCGRPRFRHPWRSTNYWRNSMQQLTQIRPCKPSRSFHALVGLTPPPAISSGASLIGLASQRATLAIPALESKVAPFDAIDTRFNAGQ